MNDRTFILESAQRRYSRLRGRNPETDVVHACLESARLHRAVAWAQRMNVAAGKLYNEKTKKLSQFTRFGFPGCPDIMGQLRSGHILMIECKFGRGELSFDQRRFLNHAQQHGAAVIVARDPLKVIAELDLWV